MKRLKSDKFSYENSYVRQVSVTPSDPRHYMAICGNDKWENVRYCLEKQMGCFKFTLPMKVVQNSYISAFYQYSVIGMSVGTSVTSKTQIYAGDIVVITRMPQPKHLHAYIPPKYWSDLGEMSDLGENMSEGNVTMNNNNEQTEESKLEALLEQSTGMLDTSCVLPPIVIRLLKQRILHPTDYVTLTTPHPLFVCQYCVTQGKHFHTLCPFTETNARQNTTELVTKVRRVVGIPKSRLRFATEEEVSLEQYYLNETNEKVVILRKEIEQPISIPISIPIPPKKKEKKNLVVNNNTGNSGNVNMNVIVLDEVEYEAQLQFDFEDHIEEQDRLEQEREDKFYETHPELKKKKNQICTHYYRGICHKGKLECEFLHSGDENYIAICQFFVNDQCTEINCMFRHPPKHLFNNECNAYKRGFCEKGNSCKYKHVKYMNPGDNSELDPEIREAMFLALSQRISLPKKLALSKKLVLSQRLASAQKLVLSQRLALSKRLARPPTMKATY